VNIGIVLGVWVEIHNLRIVVLYLEAGNVALEFAGVATHRCDNMCSKFSIPESVNPH